MDEIGKWYDQQDREARRLWQELQELEGEDLDERSRKQKRKLLEEQLEAARYVGD